MPTPAAYISYAWGDETPGGKDREAIVDDLCRSFAEVGIVIGRDKNEVKAGDSIEKFGRRIAKAPLILAVISHKALRSQWCMIYELYEAYMRCGSDVDEFAERVAALVLEDAEADLDVEKTELLIEYWKAWKHNVEKTRSRRTPELSKVLMKCEDMIESLPDILLAIRKIAMPRGSAAIRRDDFRIKRFRDRKQTTTIFLVDASGSAALERLGEAKGAVELLLADCYIRRDEVALIAFRGVGADILLPPTRSLHRAKKELAALPGGGGTPLAAGIMAAGLLADEVRRKGRTPTLVLITDGRANVTREGLGGRAQAQDEAGIAARSIRAQGLRTLLVDNSNRPEPRAGQLADDMGALYLPLPRANSQMISNAVRASAPAAQAVRR
jgi:Mg-chelatase subunit ChlD